MKKVIKKVNVILLMLICLLVGEVVGSSQKPTTAEATITAEEQQDKSTHKEDYSIFWSDGNQYIITLDILNDIHSSEKIYPIYVNYHSQTEFYEVLNNGSFAYVNEDEKIYSFTPAELGDWNYNVNNLEDLNNLIDTYVSIHNNGYY